jgi:hypothetical protein
VPRASWGSNFREAMRRRTWKLLIDYCNSGKGFGRLIDATLADIDGDREMCADFAGGREIRELAREYLTPTRELLRWLSKPQQKTLGVRCCKFLEEHGANITWRWQYGNFDEHRPDDTFLLDDYPAAMPSVMSPICRFVKDQIDLHSKYFLPLHLAIPVARCHLQGCGKFRLIEKLRKGPVFDSDNCRAKYRQLKMSKRSKAAYMRDYRERLDPHRPRRKLRRGNGQTLRSK